MRSQSKPPSGSGAAATGALPSAGDVNHIDAGILPQLLGYNLRRAQIALWRDFTSTVGQGEVRPGLFSLLMLVEANPGIAQVDIAHQLDVDKATIVSLVDRLERRQWVRRERSRLDRRRQGIFLTPVGRRGLKTLRRNMLAHEKRFTSRFTPAELRQLISMLRRIHP